jgi:hypothetical protein
MDEDSVAQFLIDNSYHLTALEFFCETFERNGHPVESLSRFFEDSANFLLFEDMRSISEISSTGSDPTAACSDAIRIKDDRIAVLEHELHILRDSLAEANSQLQHQKVRIAVESPPSVFDSPPDDEEDSVLNQLIVRYLKTRCLKLSQLAFNNETNADKLTDRVNLPEDVDLVHLLRIFRFVEQTPHMPEEIEKLRAERDQMRLTVSQLMTDLESARKHGPTRHSGDVTVITVPEIMDNFFNDIMQLVNAVDVSERRRMIRPLRSIMRYHPDRDSPMQ